MNTLPQLAFIGVGNMGNPMAMNLLKAGYALKVFDIDPSKTLNLKQAGAQVADSLAEVVHGVNVVMVSLPGPTQVAQVMLGDAGVLSKLSPGVTVIDTTTSSVDLIQQLVELSEKRSVHYLEAPVTNAVDFAALGKLSIFVGGSLSAFETHKPVLEVIGEKIFHVGKAGNGATVKLLTNLLWFVSAATIGEALMLGAKADIPLHTVWEAIKSSAGNSWVAEHDVPSIFAGHYDPSFSLALCCKDLGLINAIAQSQGYQLPMGSHVLSLFEKAQAVYGPQAAELHVVKLLEDQVGHYLRPDPVKVS